MNIGFTGTRKGMTDYQRSELWYHLANKSSSWGQNIFHHGDCVGADAEAHDLAMKMSYEVHIHPPLTRISRAFKLGHKVYSPKHYLDRNHDIVDACDVLLAAPATKQEQLRSGTWATIRYARKVGKPVHILEP